MQSSTWVAMLEAYADFRVLGRMEMFYAKITNSKAFLKDGLIRKIAQVTLKIACSPN